MASAKFHRPATRDKTFGEQISHKKMEFLPSVQLKKASFKLSKLELSKFKSLQIPKFSKKVTGLFNGFSVIISELDDGMRLYELGCYGKGAKSRSAPRILDKLKKRETISTIKTLICDKEEELILDLEEAFFLCYTLKCLRIINLDNEEISNQQLLEEFTKIQCDFMTRFIVYYYLKTNLWIVKSGIKFGGDFLLYRYGPEYDHANFVVFIANEKHREAHNIQGLQRIAETSGKNVLFLEIYPPNDYNPNRSYDFLDKLSEFRVSELIVTRFDYKQFVQTKKLS